MKINRKEIVDAMVQEWFKICMTRDPNAVLDTPSEMDKVLEVVVVRLEDLIQKAVDEGYVEGSHDGYSQCYSEYKIAALKDK